MTAYEIAEVRAQLEAQLLGLIRLWLTAMFAAFAVAHVTGKSLDPMSIGVLIVFYGTIVGIVVSAMTMGFQRIATLIEDAEAVESQPMPGIVSRQMMTVPRSARVSIRVAMVVSFIVFCIYLFQQTA